MFVFSFKATTLKYIGVMGLCAMAIVLTVALVPSNSLSEGLDNSIVEVAAERKTGDFKNIKSNADRITFLKSYGWEADSEPINKTSVTVPEVFDSVYNEYNKLQKKQGLDLEEYSGKEVELYTYRVTNANGEAYANMLVYKNRIIGGDISSASPDGFIWGFDGE